MSTHPINLSHALHNDDLLFYKSLDKAFYSKVALKWRANRVWRKGFIINDVEWMNEVLSLVPEKYVLSSTIIPYFQPETLEAVKASEEAIITGNKPFLEETSARLNTSEEVDLVNLVTKYVYRGLFLMTRTPMPASLDEVGLKLQPEDEVSLLSELRSKNLRDFNPVLRFLERDRIQSDFIQPIIRTITFLVNSESPETVQDFLNDDEVYANNVHRAVLASAPYPLIELEALEKHSTHGTVIKRGETVLLNVHGAGRRLLSSSPTQQFTTTPGLQFNPLFGILLHGLLELFVDHAFQVELVVNSIINETCYESVTVSKI